LSSSAAAAIVIAIITAQSAVNGAIMKEAVAQKRKNVARFGEPELALALHGNGPDPRLVELARLLARRAARKWYDHLAEEQRLSLLQ
jgi:hypothetical protein